MIPDTVLFASPSAFRKWLDAHHATKRECWVRFHKKHTQRGGLTYQEALDEGLCFGWIDGLKKRIDDASYTIRFSPRTARSIWSAVNITRVDELTARGRMQPPGMTAFRARDTKRSRLYSYENRPRALAGQYVTTFRANRAAWRFFQDQAPSYQRAATWWIMSAKLAPTRVRRLTTLIAVSADASRLDNILATPPAKRSG